MPRISLTARAVADASTLIYLAKIGPLDPLPTYFDSVLVPPAVWREVLTEGDGEPGAEELEETREDDWAKLEEPTNTELLKLLSRELGAGEAEAIALATEHPDHILLLDEAAAREVADVYELEKTAVVGLLLRARLEDKIPSLADALEALRGEAGFWIGDDLIEQVLSRVDENQKEAGG